MSPILLLFFAALAQAALIPPTITAAPYMNASYANPPQYATLTGPSCPVNCSYTFSTASKYTWVKVKASTTITRAVEYVIVNRRTNTTRTSTSTFELPADHTMPLTNEAGTRVWRKTISAPVSGATTWTTFVTSIAYPTVFTQYPSGYHWWGVLPTTAPGGESVCSWAPDYYTGLNPSTKTTTISRSLTSLDCFGVGTSQPMQQSCITKTPGTTTSTSTSYTWIPVATGAHVNFTSIQDHAPSPWVDPEDPRGYLYVVGVLATGNSNDPAETGTGMPLSGEGPSVDTGMGVPLPDQGPPGVSDAAFSSCAFTYARDPNNPWIATVNPVLPVESAYYLTLTSTSIEDDDGPTATSEASVNIGNGLGSLLATATGAASTDAVVSSGASAALDQPSETSAPQDTSFTIGNIISEAATNPLVSYTVDGVAYTPSSAQSSAGSAQSTAEISFAFPTPAASPSATEASDTASFNLGPSKPTSSEDQSVGIDMGFTKSSSAPALTIGIDTAQAGTPAATPGGDVSVSGEGFNIGIKPTLTGPTLILTEISGQLVLATVGATSAPATSAGTTTGLGGMILSGLGETGSSAPEQTTAASEPESPEQTTAPAESDSPDQTSAASQPDFPEQTTDAGLPVVTTAAPQEPESTAAAAAPTPVEVGGITVSQNSDTQLVVGSQTLKAGSTIVVGTGSSTTAVALETDGSSTHIVVGTATAAVPEATGSAEVAPSPIEVGGVTASQNAASEIVVGSQTLAPGSSIIVGSGSSTTAVALQTTDGTTQLVVGSTTAAIPTAAIPTAAAAAPAIIFGSQTLHPGSTLTLGTGSRTTAVVLMTDAAGRSAVVVADASTTYTVAAGTSAAVPTTTGAHLLTAGGTTELAIGATTYTFKTGGPAIALSTRGGTTVVVAGTGSAQSLIAIPTGLAEGDESSSSSSGHPPSRNGTEQSS
ncbi:hypothetical protein GTA08_BOTSDO06591 [Neofusicoccum parvum]|uniref:Uncharacterized protein n=1 Tax=Neofusicoccum parvum TaxID=310453 RepID=A0ACB5RN67_9PEZI|nr:hypothetical protein GTA08_BOTSDO06591 [Neofusicoccum parvum]